MKFIAAIALLSVSGVAGFALMATGMTKQSTALNMNPQEGAKKVAVSFVAAAFLMANVAVMEPAIAFDDMDFGTSQVVAGRSGGRAGGRSSAPRARAPSSSSTRVIQRTTYIQPSPVMVAPPMYGGGYGYNPLPGLGLSIGLNSMNQIGNDMRDYRQETEIQQTRAQLNDSKQREAQMEARLRQLEMSNQNQQMSSQQQLMMQQQMIQQKAQAQP